MSFLKSIAVPAAVVGSVCGLLALAGPADAKTYDLCLPMGEGKVCANYGSDKDEIYANFPTLGGVEEIEVKCFGNGQYDWESVGSWTAESVDVWVMNYCNARPGVHR